MENSKILTKKIEALIIVNLLLIVLALVAINFSEIDLVIQNWFFDFEKKTWAIDKNEAISKFIFYQLPKVLFGILMFVCFFGIVFSTNKTKSRFRICDSNFGCFLTKNYQRLWLIFLGLAIIPLIAGNIKKYTNIYCPGQLKIFDGDKPYVKIFDSYPPNFMQTKKAQCFPAGHAVTGFALLILFFALPKKRQRILGFLGASIFGWILGFYQMAKGAHFFGDTLVSYLTCFFLAGLITRIFLKFSKL
jgi:membrane-associated PAP2 superfamily phosphatase